MNSLRNRVQLIGNLGNDPEIKSLTGGKMVANFSIATSESYKREDGEKVTDTQWHKVVAWNGTAKIVEKLLTKGCNVAIEGKLTSRSWEDKDGNKKYITEVVASEILLLKSAKSQD
jgi:single-strand DNA-binding protein